MSTSKTADGGALAAPAPGPKPAEPRVVQVLRRLAMAIDDDEYDKFTAPEAREFVAWLDAPPGAAPRDPSTKEHELDEELQQADDAAERAGFKRGSKTPAQVIDALAARATLAEQREMEARRTAEEWRNESNDNADATERIRQARERIRRDREELIDILRGLVSRRFAPADDADGRGLTYRLHAREWVAITAFLGAFENERCPYAGFRDGAYYCHRRCAMCGRPVPVTPAVVHDPGHPHLIAGEFQSDKYPSCPRGKVPLSCKDRAAQDLLWDYAQRRRVVDAEFAGDLEEALRRAGYNPGPNNPPVPTHCKACHHRLLLGNLFVDDGCPCNSRRGVNFEPKRCGFCKTDDCVKPGHRILELLGYVT